MITAESLLYKRVESLERSDGRRMFMSGFTLLERRECLQDVCDHSHVVGLGGTDGHVLGSALGYKSSMWIQEPHLNNELLERVNLLGGL